jgi:hypothetical protein
LCDNSFTVIKSNIISSKIQKLNLNYRNLPFILKLFNFVCLLIFENETTILKKNSSLDFPLVQMTIIILTTRKKKDI